MNNVDGTIISQYGTSPTIYQLVQNINEYIDPTVDIDAFYSTIFDIDQATGANLDNWGKILGGISRTVNSTTTLSDSDYRQLLYLKATANITDMSIPSLNALVNAMIVIWTATATPTTYTNLTDQSGNLILDQNGNEIVYATSEIYSGYVQDSWPMAIVFVFLFTLTTAQNAMMLNRDLIPRPAGVDAYIMQYTTPSFSFQAGDAFGVDSFFSGLEHAI